MPIVVPDDVKCLSQDGDLSYACTSLGLARVNGPTLGEEVFSLSWMVGPDLTRLEGAERDLCNSQWLDLLLDLMVAGIPRLAEEMPDPGGAGAGASAGAGGGAPQAGMGAAGVIAAGSDGSPLAG